MTLGERILELRKKHGLSQEELAITLGVSRQAVSKWETGDAMPDTDKVIALAVYFKVTTDWLLRGIEAAPAPAGPAGTPSREELENASPMLLALTLGGCLVGLILILYDISQQYLLHIPAIIGILLQIGSSSLATGVGLYLRNDAGRRFLRTFWSIAVWMIAPLLFGFLYTICSRTVSYGFFKLVGRVVPFFNEGGWPILFPAAVCFTGYVVFCLIITLLLRRLKKS